MSTIKVDNLQTTGGAGLYPARAWVNFNGTGTPSIRGDGNVSSLTDLGTGRFDVNLTNVSPDANGATLSNYSSNDDVTTFSYSGTRHRSTSQFRLGFFSGGFVDPLYGSAGLNR